MKLELSVSKPGNLCCSIELCADVKNEKVFVFDIATRPSFLKVIYTNECRSWKRTQVSSFIKFKFSTLCATSLPATEISRQTSLHWIAKSNILAPRYYSFTIIFKCSAVKFRKGLNESTVECASSWRSEVIQSSTLYFINACQTYKILTIRSNQGKWWEKTYLFTFILRQDM